MTGFQGLPGLLRLGTLSSVTATADLLHAAAVRQNVRATWSRSMRAFPSVFVDDDDGPNDDDGESEDDEPPVPRPRANSREAITE